MEITARPVVEVADKSRKIAVVAGASVSTIRRRRIGRKANKGMRSENDVPIFPAREFPIFHDSKRILSGGPSRRPRLGGKRNSVQLALSHCCY
jgi:hypothetical protein